MDHKVDDNMMMVTEMGEDSDDNMMMVTKMDNVKAGSMMLVTKMDVNGCGLAYVGHFGSHFRSLPQIPRRVGNKIAQKARSRTDS